MLSSSHVSLSFLEYERNDTDVPEGIGARLAPRVLERFSDTNLCIPISYGTAKSGVGISAMSVLRPDLMMKCVIPVIMAGIIAVRRFVLVWRSDAFLPAYCRSTALSYPC